MPTGTISTSTDVTALAEQYSKELSLAANEEDVVRQTMTDYGEPLNNLYVRKISAISSATFTDGEAISPQQGLFSRAILAPTNGVAAVSLTVNVPLRAGIPLSPALRTQLVASINAKIVTDLLSNMANFSNTVGSAASDLDEAMALGAKRTLIKNAKNMIQLGTTPIYLVVHADQTDNLESIPNWVRFDARGDGASPIVKGWVYTARGFTFKESGAVPQSGGSTYNGAYIKQAVGYGFNTKPDVVVRDSEFWLANRLAAFADYAHGEVRDEYGVTIITTTTP